MSMNTADGVKLGSNWECLYFIRYSFDLDLKFEGSQKDRVKQFEDYIAPIVMPFVEEYGLASWDDYDGEEDLRKEFLPWLEGDFTECGTLAEWCERKGYKALCYWDLHEECGDNHEVYPVWLA